MARRHQVLAILMPEAPNEGMAFAEIVQHAPPTAAPFRPFLEVFMRTSADTETPAADGLSGVVQRNIRDILAARRQIEDRETSSERMASVITRAAGSMWFAYLHILWFGAWIAVNVLRGREAFDPYPFVMLTTVVSLEAIFLTLMVLVSQNREAKLEEQRADLDLQIDLLAEHEITGILSVVNAIARKVGVEEVHQKNVQDLEQEVRPRDLIDELERTERLTPKAERKRG